MADFFGRSKELEALEKAYRSPNSEFIPIYGRRRVGKSELVLHFTQNKPSVYFVGYKSPVHIQIESFLETASKNLNLPVLARVRVTNWKEAFEEITNQYQKKDKKLIIALDEFQWIVESSPELPSILQSFIDGPWKKNKNIFLILCGSYMGFMEREVLGSKSPLFGRRTAQIFLKPFPFWEARAFHPGWSLADCARLYMICGGIPYYLRFFSDKKTLSEGFISQFFNEYSALFREPEFLLREELRELVQYQGILLALARGRANPSEIASITGIDHRKLHYYLQNLIDLGYVKKSNPLVVKKGATSRDVQYILDDPLLWFHFIAPSLSTISTIGPREAYLQLIKPYLEAYLGYRFEEMCRQALAKWYGEQGLATPFEIGSYWDKKTQIDVVGYRQNEGIDLGECKWGKTISPAKAYQELKEKIETYPNPKGLTLRKFLFIPQKPSDKSKTDDCQILTLEDMYRIKK